METFSPNIDKISENIIYLLSLDAKITISDIAKKLVISRKVVENRIQRLYKKGFINPLLVFNYNEMLKATILIKLSKFDKEIIDAMKQIRQLVKLKETLGMYDLSLLLITENKSDLDKIVYKINKLFHKNIQSMDILIHEWEDTLGYKSFCNDLNLLGSYHRLSYDKNYSLNEDDKKVLNILRINPHISFRKLIEITDWKYAKLKSIISNLLVRDIIRFSVDPNYNILGLEFHNILIKINLAKAKIFEERLIKHPRVHWIKKGTGRWDYILSICSKNVNEFIDIIREIRTKNKDLLFDFSTLISKINVMRKY